MENKFQDNIFLQNAKRDMWGNLVKTVPCVSLCHKNLILKSINFNKEVFKHVFLNEKICNEFDERFCKKLREKLSINDNAIQIDLNRIPCYQKIVDLIDDGTVNVEKNESNDFQKTCAYFNLLELQQYTEIYFIEGLFQ